MQESPGPPLMLHLVELGLRRLVVTEKIVSSNLTMQPISVGEKAKRIGLVQ